MRQNGNQTKIRRMVEQDVKIVNSIDRELSGSKRVRTWLFPFEVFWNIYRPELSFVAEVKGEVVGFLIGTIEKEERSQSIFSLGPQLGSSSVYRQSAWIDMIGIYPEHQGKGIGRALVNAFYNECKPKNVTMRWTIRDDDEVLSKFAASLGFKKSPISTYEMK